MSARRGLGIFPDAPAVRTGHCGGKCPPWHRGGGRCPVLTLAEVQLQLDFRAFLHRQVQVDGLFLRQGRLVWSLSPTNELRLDNLEAGLRFQVNETWSLDKFQADFTGAKLAVTGEISHAPELRNWEMFHGSSTNRPTDWLAKLKKFSESLNQVHFTGPPQLKLTVSGDARSVHSFRLQLKAAAPAVQSPWLDAHDLQLTASLSAPATAPTNNEAAWGFWTNIQPYQLAWSASATQLESQKLQTAAVTAGGFWHAPELVVSNLSVELGNGRLDADAKLNVATRELVFTNSSCFDVHALDALLTEKVRAQLTEILWTLPPSLQIGGALILPAWTNAQPDWPGEVARTVRLAGNVTVTNVTVHGTLIDSAQAHFACDKEFWDFSDLTIVQARTQLRIGGSADAVTKNFHAHIRGAVDPESARPFLKESNAVHGLDLVKLAEPMTMDVDVGGRWSDWNSLVAGGRLAVTNITVRGQHFSDVTTTVDYTNRVLAFVRPLIHIGAQTGTADSIALDFNARLIYFKNILSAMDPEPVVRAIGPKTWKLVEPYHFPSPPTTRVNGQIPLADLHGGPEMDAVDMRFDIIKGAPFEWLKLKTTNIVGEIHWRGQTLLLTNAVAAFHGGTADGFADFNFRVPHEGGDYHFAVNLTNVNLHELMADLSSPSNSLEGTLAGQMVMTNASTESVESWRGFGQASLHNGLLWDVPIISIVSPVLNTVSPGLGNSRATEAAGKFQMANGVITTDSLTIRSTMTRLDYVGTVDLQQNVNAHVTAQLLRDTWVIGPLVSTALWPVSKIFEYRVTGTLQNPKSEPLYVLPKLLLFPLHPIRTLENLFSPGETPVPEPKVPPEH
ncbi:MAG: AsmA-like C-terminal region-containing protein [Limisphaerales bacterium]